MRVVIAEDSVLLREGAARLLEGEGGVRNVDQLFAEIDTLAETADERAEEILGAMIEQAFGRSKPWSVGIEEELFVLDADFCVAFLAWTFTARLATGFAAE